MYCPNLDVSNSTTWPVICPPTPQCSVQRIAQLTWCSPQGTYEPTICPAGYYCPPPGKLQLLCPVNYFCPLGTANPIPCPWLSVCNKGSSTYLQIGAIAVLIAIDGSIGLACFTYYMYRRRKHKLYYYVASDRDTEVNSSTNFGLITGSTTRATTNAIPRADIEAPDAKMSDLQNQYGSEDATTVLIENFHKCRGNQPLLEFEFDSLGLSIPGKNKILHGVTGKISHGQVTAVMGPSGAGKTTFLSTLMGKVESSWKTEGSLKVNGVESKGLSKLNKLIGYVPQEDVMHRELSVWQNLQYSADVRLPSTWTSEERQVHVKAVLDTLDLVDVRNATIGDESIRGISGGQRKRVNIGLELAACPLALFCDEPTSGLDASASLSVVTAVKNVAKTTGMTVVMVIHQPRVEIWNSLDRILILAPGGITAYLGEQRHCQAYFEQHLGVSFHKNDNPADLIMDQVAEFGKEFAEVWRTTGIAWLRNFVDSQKDSDILKDHVSNNNTSSKKNKSKAAQQNNSNDSDSIEMEHASSNSQSNQLSGNTETRIAFKSEIPDVQEVERGASFFFQLWLVFVRAIKQQYVNLPSLVLEMALALLAGGVIGFSARFHYTGLVIAPYTLISPATEVTTIPQKSLYISMSVGIAAASAGVKTFGEETVIFWREAAAGHNRLAYYLGVSLSVIPRIILGGFHFATIFQLVSQGYTSYGQMVVNMSLIFFAVYGLAALVSMIVPRKDAPLLAAVICVVAAVLNGYVRAMPHGLDYISYAYWSADAYFTGETNPFTHILQVNLTENFYNYSRNRLSLDYGLMFGIGVVYRIIGFLLLIFLNRDKQR